MKRRYTFSFALVLMSFVLTVSASTLNNHQNSNSSEERIYESSEVDQKAKITFKAEPMYTEKARRHRTSGRVILRVVLKSTGEIGDITVIQGLPDGLTEQSMIAARQMKFEPAIKEGRPVSQYVKTEYNFSIWSRRM